MQQFDQPRLFAAFISKKRWEGYTYKKLAKDARVCTASARNIVLKGRGHEQNVDRVARALGFNGRKDLVVMPRRFRRAGRP